MRGLSAVTITTSTWFSHLKLVRFWARREVRYHALGLWDRLSLVFGVVEALHFIDDRPGVERDTLAGPFAVPRDEGPYDLFAASFTNGGLHP